MVGGRPQLVAPVVGRPGPDGDLFQGLPVAVLAGTVDQPEEPVEVAGASLYAGAVHLVDTITVTPL